MLSEEQKAEVAKWFANGATLDEIQKRMKSEFNVHMTYLDLRLMVAELPQPQEPEPEKPEPEQQPEERALDAGDSSAAQPPQRYDLDAPDADEGNPVPGVAVEIDALTIPGTYASGDVTFSDGVKAKWYLDQQGRLGIGKAPEGYRPSPTDGAIFQSRLMELLRSRGMM